MFLLNNKTIRMNYYNYLNSFKKKKNKDNNKSNNSKQEKILLRNLLVLTITVKSTKQKSIQIINFN